MLQPGVMQSETEHITKNVEQNLKDTAKYQIFKFVSMPTNHLP